MISRKFASAFNFSSKFLLIHPQIRNYSKMTERGLFIVFEGLDRSGKTTQSKRLVENLRKEGHTVSHINFPNRETTIGKMINSYLTNGSELKDEVVHLLFSANRWECSGPQIEEELAKGNHVVCDRYAFSGVAFTSAKGLDFDWCKNPDVGLPAPDKVFYLDIDPEDAKKRAEFGNERYEKLDFQKKVGAIFNGKFADAESFWTKVDALQDMDEITKQIGDMTSEMISKPKAPVQRLWVDAQSEGGSGQ